MPSSQADNFVFRHNFTPEEEAEFNRMHARIQQLQSQADSRLAPVQSSGPSVPHSAGSEQLPSLPSSSNSASNRSFALSGSSVSTSSAHSSILPPSQPTPAFSDSGPNHHESILSPPPSSQPTYGAINHRYRSQLQNLASQHPAPVITQSPITPTASQISHFQVRGMTSLAPQLNTSNANRARRASAVATLPQYRQQSMPTSRRGRGRQSIPSIARALPPSVARCINTATNEIEVTAKVYPPIVSQSCF